MRLSPLTLIPLVILACREPEAPRTPDEAARTIRAVLGDHRPAAPRLSVDLGYAACEIDGQDFGVERCSSLESLDVRRGLELDRLASELEAAASNDPAPQTDHASGLLHFLWSREVPEELERAISALRAAAGSSADDPSILIDLGAALYREASCGKRPQSLIEAVDAWRRAVELAPDRPAAHFNLALGFHALGLGRAALAAWDRAIELEPDSPWAREARVRRLALLKQAARPSPREAIASAEDLEAQARDLVASYPEAMYARLVEDLLPELGQRILDDDAAGREKAYREARAVASAIAAQLGDLTGLETLGTLDSADSSALLALAEGLVVVGRARELYERERKSGEAERTLRSAVRQLRPTPLSAWAGQWLARIEINSNRSGAGLTRLSHIESTVDPVTHPVLAARVRWLRALVGARQGLDNETFVNLRRALYLYRGLGFKAGQAAMHSMLADAMGNIGMTGEAWRHRLAALRNLEWHREDRAPHNTLLDAAEDASDADLPQVAIPFLNQALALAEARGSDLDVAEVHNLRGQVRGSMGLHGEAMQDFEEAARRVRKLGDTGLTRRALTDIETGQVKLQARTSPEPSLERLDTLTDYYRDHRLHWEALGLLLERSRLRRQLGLLKETGSDLNEAIELYLQQSRGLGELADRYAHALVIEGITDEMIALQLELDVDPSIPLAYAETSRLLPLGADAWTGFRLPHSPGDYSALGRRIRQLAEDLPAQTLLVEYIVLTHRVLVWTADRNGIRCLTIPVEAAELSVLASEHTRAVLVDDPRSNRLSSELYSLLVEPVRAANPGIGHWVIVPDRFLHEVAFAALRSAGRFLIEDVEVSYAVSMVSYLAGRVPKPALPRREWRGLFVADPDFDRDAFPLLGDLEAADREIDNALRYYSADSVVLRAEEATSRRILKALLEVDLLHYAGHAVVRRERPLESTFLVAGSRIGLTARELVDVEMPRLQLVVLSGCETAGAAPTRLGGLTSLAAPFLLNGARAVVGSLWTVVDESSADFMTRFHKLLAQTDEPRRALRDTQLSFLSHTDPTHRMPAAWASYVILETQAAK